MMEKCEDLILCVGKVLQHHNIDIKEEYALK